MYIYIYDYICLLALVGRPPGLPGNRTCPSCPAACQSAHLPLQRPSCLQTSLCPKRKFEVLHRSKELVKLQDSRQHVPGYPAS